MKRTIIAKHTGSKATDHYYYWEYDNHTTNVLWADECDYAIVDTEQGLQLVKIVGIAAVKDDTPATKKVVMFIRDLKTEDEQVDNQQ